MTDENDRINKLYEICFSTRHGVVENIQIDLRHKLLDPREWRMHDAMGIAKAPFYGYADQPGLPFIWFPWYGLFDWDALRAEAARDFEATLKLSEVQIYESSHKVGANDRIKFIRDYVSASTPHAIVRNGEKLVIRSVQDIAIGDEFDHPHDAIFRLAYLEIVGRNGKIRNIEKPIRFIGATSSNTKGSERDAFDRIARRICRHFGVSVLKDIEWDKGGFSSAAAQYAKYVSYESNDALNRYLFSTDYASPQYQASAQHWRAVNWAVLMGYYWAKAEAELRMKPLAVSALKVKAGGSSGGLKSGRKRRENRALGWERIARDLAISIRAKVPSLSQSALATEIDHKWTAEEPKAPGHTMLVGLISEMEKAGELPKRRKLHSGLNRRRAFNRPAEAPSD